MTPTRAEILTGLLVVLTGAVAVGFLVLIGQGALFTDTVHFVTYVANTSDLRENADVHFEGARVGAVEAVTWDATRRAYRLDLSVPRRVPVKTDSVARIRSVRKSRL